MVNTLAWHLSASTSSVRCIPCTRANKNTIEFEWDDTHCHSWERRCIVISSKSSFSLNSTSVNSTSFRFTTRLTLQVRSEEDIRLSLDIRHSSMVNYKPRESALSSGASMPAFNRQQTLRARNQKNFGKPWGLERRTFLWCRWKSTVASFRRFHSV